MPKFLILICVLVLVTIMYQASSSHAIPASEYQVKAAFLYNFAKFVLWPPTAFSDEEAPLVIGILGEDPFKGNLEQIVKGETVKGRNLVVKRYKHIDDLHTCHVLFIAASEEKRLRAIFDAIEGLNVLTVSEVTNFAQNGGIINFIFSDKRVRFEINLDAAERAGLGISSKLLRLAKLVKSKHDSKNN